MSPVTIKPAWRLGDPQIERDALAFWDQHQMLPDHVDKHSRVKQLCCAAYDGDVLVGVATVALAEMPAVRQRFAHFRCAVAPDRRGEGIAPDLTSFARKLLEEWSAGHPEEKVMGFVAVLQGYESRRTRIPTDPHTGLMIGGYTPEGHTIALAWFKHARVD